MLTGRKASGPQTSSLSATEAGRRGMTSPSRGWPTGQWSHHPGLSGTGCALLVQVENTSLQEVWRPPGHWLMAPR